MFNLLYLVPKNYLSWFIGRLAHISRPKFLVLIVIKCFVGRYGVDVSEISSPLDSFPSLGDFFVRELKSGARPIGDGIVSPVDGKVSQLGKIENGLLLQVKGKHYRLEELLGGAEFAKDFVDGFYITIYLAPPDYHRIHSPVAGDVLNAQHIPGKLWPVNSWSVERIDNLFAVNERITTYLNSEAGKVAVVKVGATNVGSISLSFDEMKSNQHPPLLFDVRKENVKDFQNVSLAKGQHLGTFHMGSTVILLFQAGKFQPDSSLQVGKKLKVGQTIGY